MLDAFSVRLLLSALVGWLDQRQQDAVAVTGRVLFVFVVLPHHRRQIVHFNATEHPTAVWLGIGD